MDVALAMGGAAGVSCGFTIRPPRSHQRHAFSRLLQQAGNVKSANLKSLKRGHLLLLSVAVLVPWLKHDQGAMFRFKKGPPEGETPPATAPRYGENFYFIASMAVSGVRA